jgi:phosphoglycolate phosphatase
VKEIAFDFDGTLVDSLAVTVEVLNEILPKFGLRRVKREEVDFFRKNGARATIKKSGLSWWKIARINGAVKRALRERMKEVRMIAGMEKLWQDLKREGWRIGLVSSNDRKNIRFKADYVIAGGSLLGKARLLRKLKKNTIYVGDEVRDIEAARKAGVKIIAVSWGFNDKEALKRAKPDYLVETVAELRKLLIELVLESTE